MKYGTIRTKNPAQGIEAIFVNPLPPSKGSTMKKRYKKPNPPLKRDSKGKFLPRKSNPKPRKRNDDNPPRKYYRAKNDDNPRPRKRNDDNPPRKYYRAKNDDNPKPKRRKNPNGLAERYQSIKHLVKPALSAIGGFLLPGIVWAALGDTYRNKIMGWFKTGNIQAKGRTVVTALVNGALFAGLHFLGKKNPFLQSIKWSTISGSLLRLGMDLADTMIPATAEGKTLRMIFGLPVTLALPPATTGTTPATTGTTPAADTTGTTPATDTSKETPPDTGKSWEELTPEQQTAAEKEAEKLFGGVTYPLPSGFEGVQYPQPSGLADAYITRRLELAGYPAYDGMGDLYLNRDLAYLEQGQRYPVNLKGF